MKNVLFTLCCLLLLEEAKAVSKEEKCKLAEDDNMCMAQDDEQGAAMLCTEDTDCGIN